MRELKVSKNEAGQRLDKLLHKYLREAGDGFIYKMLRKKNIVLNDKKATGKEMLQSGDTVKLYFSEDTFEKMGAGVTEESAPFGCKLPKDFEKWIVFQDDALLILNKPAGVLSQSDDREKLSINEYCLQYLFEKGEVTEETLRTFKPGICNRLTEIPPDSFYLEKRCQHCRRWRLSLETGLSKNIILLSYKERSLSQSRLTDF